MLYALRRKMETAWKGHHESITSGTFHRAASQDLDHVHGVRGEHCSARQSLTEKKGAERRLECTWNSSPRI